MASSSQVSRIKYDVFISFRGTDVRSGFLSHLKKELQQKHIDAYVDDRLERGDEISPTLIRAIEESRISLIIFSKDYASSEWCLEELVKIMECMHRYQQIVIPVFYNTYPSDVRHQEGSYGDAFAQHDKNYKDKVQLWRSALNKVANLSGFHSSKYKDEAELVEQVAKSLFTRLNKKYSYDLRNLVGIDKKIAELESLMHQGSEDVRVIGIWGMGGIGKTTIATAVFNRFCFEYEGCYFLANVREESRKHGIIDLKNKILSMLLKENDLHIGTSNGVPSYVKRKLLRTKVLLVLDDINDADQLENLVEVYDCFGPGSKIIITTRDKQVLNGKFDKIYEVKPLMVDQALELFNLNAFKENCLDMEWIELSRRMIEYAKKLPLALKVLGSFLHGKSKEEWKNQLKKLDKTSLKKIHDVLRLSYDSLDPQQKNVFLYIACCFKGYEQRQIIALLDACGFETSIELKVLQNKALISWKSEMSIVSMHDLIEEMGREIVRKESMDDPGKRSRLWDPNDIYEVLQNNKGTENIQSITLDSLKSDEDLLLDPQVFARMHKLKFLKLLSDHRFWERTKVHLPKGLGSLPTELRLLHWPWYPLESLPSTFCAKNLVELHMTYSKLQKLWDGVMPLGNLKKINLSGSKCLLELPNFSLAKNLEEVMLSGCENLCVIHPSILSLPKLEKLDLSYCYKLTCLRSDIHLKSLCNLRLESCSRLEEFSVTSENMIELNLSRTAVKKLPLSIGCLRRLEYLKLDKCISLTHLPSNLVDLRSLRRLCIGGCIELRSLPELPPSIEELWAPGCTSLETVQFTSMAGDPLNSNIVGVRLVNCIKLDEHSRNAIGLTAHLSLTNYAFKSPEERKSVRDDDIKQIVICPGSKVPKWFKYRTSQGSITIAPHSKLLGFIFCMILCESDSFRVDWFLENNDGERLNLKDMGGYDCDGYLKAVDLYSDHVCICYAECSGLINEKIEESRDTHQNKTHNPKLSFEFMTWKGNRVVKKCGVYPIYAVEEDEDEDEDEMGNKS